MNTHSKFLRTAVAAMLLAIASTGWALGAGLTRLSGNAPNVQGLKYLHAHSPNAVMDFTLALALQNRAALMAAEHAMQDPKSPQYRHFMTHEQLIATYSPSWTQVNTVTGYLKSQGIKVMSVTPDRLVIHARASTAMIQRAFAVNIADYSMNGETVFAPDNDPRMPQYVASVVTAVMGLNNMVQWQEHLRAKTATADTNTIAGGAGPTGFSPADLATHYNWPVGGNSLPVLTDTSLASGVTIAIATAFTYRPADVNTFWDANHLPRHTVVSVTPDGITRRLNDETTLDIEHSGAMAPGAKIMVYSGVNPQDSSFFDVFQAIESDDAADVVSTSWGECEPDETPADIGAEDGIFLLMLAQGQTIFAAAGDGGSNDGTAVDDPRDVRCPTSGGSPSGFGGLLDVDPHDNADFPSSDTGVGAAGGTSLVLGSTPSESTWIDGGGADSRVFAEPGFETGTAGWVSNTSCFGDTSDPVTFNVDASVACAAAGNASRQSADLSMDADFNLNLFYNGKWLSGFGGTSFVAPELAGLWAIAVKAYRTANPSAPAPQRLGAAPAGIFGAVTAGCQEIFTDITTGDNGTNSGNGFSAVAGWDHATGWGVPDGTLVVNYLATGTCPP
jgi:kumamolisin